MEDDYVAAVTTPEQFKALGHPMRHRLLFALAQGEATISQLAVALGSNKGNVAHHLKVLRDAGLVHVAETRQVRGGTEQYYQRSYRRLAAAGPAATAHTPALLQAVAEEIGTANDPVLILRQIRLRPEQATELATALSELVDGAEDAGEDGTQHGLLVTLYQPGTAADGDRG